MREASNLTGTIGLIVVVLVASIGVALVASAEDGVAAALVLTGIVLVARKSQGKLR